MYVMGCFLHWASKVTYHFFRATLKSQTFKWIIIGHRLAIVLLTNHISKNNVCLSEKGIKCSEIAIYRKFLKNHRNCLPPGHGQKPVWQFNNPTLELNEFNVLNRRPFLEVLSEQFLWLKKKWPLAISPHFSPFFFFLQKQSFDISDVLHREYYYSLSESKIWLILMPWILVSVTAKKWCFFWRSVKFGMRVSVGSNLCIMAQSHLHVKPSRKWKSHVL